MGATKHQIMLQNDQNIHLEFKNVNFVVFLCATGFGVTIPFFPKQPDKVHQKGEIIKETRVQEFGYYERKFYGLYICVQ